MDFAIVSAFCIAILVMWLYHDAVYLFDLNW